MYIYHFDQELPKYLFSYLSKYSNRYCEILSVNLVDIKNIENIGENILVFSSTVFEEIVVLIQIIRLLKSVFGTVEIKVVLGGSAHYMLNNDDLLQEYPEISHICIGKGEEFFKTLVEDGLPKGIYVANQFGKIKKYTVSQEYRLSGRVLLSFTDNRCNWGKCKFCHHKIESLSSIGSPEYLAEQVVSYVNSGYREFIIYDNNLNVSSLVKLLNILLSRGMSGSGIEFYLFGLRVDAEYRLLESVIRKWDKMPISGGAWGVEFYDQQVLNRFNKSSNLSQIDDAIAFFHRNDISNHVYLLLGLPGVTYSNIENLSEFISNTSYMVDQYRASYFLLNKDLIMYDDLGEYNVKVVGEYTLGDYFHKKEFTNIRTKYLNFNSWDSDFQRYQSRNETFEKYLSILSMPKVGCKNELLFVNENSLELLNKYRQM